MKEELYKYLSIGLLALLLLVCFGSLITYFVVGQESINNVAFALESGTGYVDRNYLTNNDCTVWDFNYSITDVSESNAITIYEDNVLKFIIFGTGSIVNNVLTSGSTNFVLRIVSKNDIVLSNYKNFFVGYVGNYTAYLYVFSLGVGQGGFNNVSANKYSYYRTNSDTFNFTTGSFIAITVDANSSFTMRYFGLVNTNSFSGFVPKSYENYGYNQGYTDGVNSASGGSDLSGVTDLTGVSWRAPDISNQTTLINVFDVTGSFDSLYLNGSSFTFDKVQVDSDNSIFGYDDGGIITSPLYLINSSMSISVGTIPVLENDLITFTGGDDSTNSDLISWLQANSSFLNYTDGYQDGYNSGYDIGYQDGYSVGNTDTIVQLDTTLQAFGSSVFTGVINQDPTTFWWSVQPGMQPNTAVYGYLCFNISSLPIGSIVHFNFPFQKYIVKDNSNVEYEFTDIRVLYDVDYYTNLLIAPRDSLPSIRFEQGTETYSFNVIRPGDTIILYFPLNKVTDFNRYTFGLTWSGDEYNYSFTTSSISQDIKTQLDNAYERGLKDGNSQGYTNGYTVGYNEGADGAEHYTFNNLLGAVFDAPITMFLGKYNPQTRMREGGLFNFELLGVNLTGFVIALLSIGVVLFIMRLFIRGL